ncbi:hypothetical protein QYF61_009854 [Mycteria americana]|uniref:Keratin n=1 Tax=Mycteria americana TaxID=33587 RepID=A0AAN7NBV7_MYCAM|nr:hypothetical protein QYF61_009854 [Mycteria americana]
MQVSGKDGKGGGSQRQNVHLQHRDMSCYDRCLPCHLCGPTPLVNSCNEPCVRQCQNSTVVIQPSPAVVTLPGPILSSFPPNTVVGSSTSAAVGSSTSAAVGSSTSAAVGSILSCDGVPITSGCCDLSCISSHYRGSRQYLLKLRKTTLVAPQPMALPCCDSAQKYPLGPGACHVNRNPDNCSPPERNCGPWGGQQSHKLLGKNAPLAFGGTVLGKEAEQTTFPKDGRNREWVNSLGDGLHSLLHLPISSIT